MYDIELKRLLKELINSGKLREETIQKLNNWITKYRPNSGTSINADLLQFAKNLEKLAQ